MCPIFFSQKAHTYICTKSVSRFSCHCTEGDDCTDLLWGKMKIWTHFGKSRRTARNCWGFLSLIKEIYIVYKVRIYQQARTEDFKRGGKNLNIVESHATKSVRVRGRDLDFFKRITPLASWIYLWMSENVGTQCKYRYSYPGYKKGQFLLTAIRKVPNFRHCRCIYFLSIIIQNSQ